MSDETTSTLLVFMVCFWAMMFLFSIYFDYQVTVDNIGNFRPEDQEIGILQSFFTGTFDFLSTVPIVKYFVPLAKMLTFNYGEQYVFISIVTDALGLLTAYAFWRAVKG